MGPASLADTTWQSKDVKQFIPGTISNWRTSIAAVHCNHMLPSACRMVFDDADSTNIRVRLEDSPAEPACLVNHCYGGVAFPMDINNLLDCSRVARKYDTPLLRGMVDAFAEHVQLSPENLPDCMRIAAHGPGM
jgi:hypothetical protein